MPAVTTRDSIGFPVVGRLGGTCYRLNVNLGSKANPSRAGRPSNAPQDMILVGSDVYCCHVEGDKTVSPPWGGGLNRGPYVQKWDGSAWSLIGGAVDPAADTAPAAPGDRYDPRNPRIASDGTDIFVAYYDWVAGSDFPSTFGKSYIRIAKLVGGAWVEVASEPIQGGGDGSFGGSLLSLCVASGVAYAVYSTNAWRRVRIFRSDGTGDFVDGSANYDASVGYAYGDDDGSYVAITTSSGRPVGIYGRQLYLTIGSLVCFDLTDGSVIREDVTPMGPSPIVPYGTNKQGSNILYPSSGSAVAGYGPNGDHIAFISRGRSRILVVPEDFSGPPVAIDGDDSNSFGLSSQSALALDPGDPDGRQLWITSGTNQDSIAGTISGGTEPLKVWERSCQSDHVVGNPENVDPTYRLYNTGLGFPIDGYPDYCLFGNSFYWGSWGGQPIVCDGTYIYVFWCYFPGTDNGAAFDADGATPDPGNQMQWVVTRFTISRGGWSCGTYFTPIFSTKFKIGEKADDATVLQA